MATYRETLALAVRMADTWNAFRAAECKAMDASEDEEDYTLTYLTLEHLPAEDAALARAYGFQRVIGRNSWGDIAGFVHEQALIAFVPDGLTTSYGGGLTVYPHFNLHQASFVRRWADLVPYLLPEIQARFPSEKC